MQETPLKYCIYARKSTEAEQKQVISDLLLFARCDPCRVLELALSIVTLPGIEPGLSA